MIKTILYFRILMFIMMVTTYLPLIYNRLPDYVGSHHFWTILWGVSLLFLKPKVFIQKLMLLVIIYALFLLFMIEFTWQNMDEWNSHFLWNELYVIAVGCSIITYFHVSKDYKGLAQVVKYTLLFFFITAVLTLIASIIDPMFFRTINQVTLKGIKAFYLSSNIGAASYGYILAYASLLPLLIYLFKNNQLINVNKKGLLFLILLILMVIIRVQLFTNIIFAVAFILLALVNVKNRTISFVILSVLFFILIIIPNSVYVNALNNISDSFINLKDLNFKLKEFAFYLESGGEVGYENAVAGRAERYPLLFDVFPKSPIFGCYFLSDITGNGYKVEAVHLYWMNKLTTIGIVGFLMYIFIIFNFLKNEIKIITNEYRYYFILGSIIILFYGFFKTIIGRETWYMFFVIIPGMYYLPLLNKKNNLNENEEGIIHH